MALNTWYDVQGIMSGSSAISGGFRWKINSQNIVNNTSNVTVAMWLRKDSGSGVWNAEVQTASKFSWNDGTAHTSYINTTFDLTVATAGVKYVCGIDTAVFPVGSTHTFDVPHNADGSKSISMSSYFYADSNPYFDSVSTGPTSLFLDTIPRASQPTLDVSSKDFGGTFTVTTNRVSSGFTHNLYYTFGTKSWVTIATGVTTSVTWVVPTSLGSEIPSAASGSGTLWCETYNGSTHIGTKTVPFTLTVPASWRALLTTAHSGFSWTNSPAQLTGYTIQNISKLTLTLSAGLNALVSSYGTTITSYQVSFGSYNSGEVAYSNVAASKVAGLITASGTQYANFKVKDARGYWSNDVSEKIMGTGSTIYSYDTPTNSGFNVSRHTTPTTANFQMSFGRSSIASQNTWSYQRQRRSGASWINIDTAAVAISGDTITSILTHSLPYVEATVYELRVKLTDLFSTVYYQDTLPTSEVPLALTRYGIGVGKIPTGGGTYDLEVGADGISSDGPILIKDAGVLTSIAALFALASHTHATYSLTSHNHAGVYAPAVHTHDDRYYTETEADSRFARPMYAGNECYLDYNGANLIAVRKKNGTYVGTITINP